MTFGALISACAEGQQWQQSLSFLDEMRPSGLQPDVITFSALIGACSTGQLWQRALGFLDEMRHGGRQPDVTTFSALLSARDGLLGRDAAQRPAAQLAQQSNCGPVKPSLGGRPEAR